MVDTKKIARDLRKAIESLRKERDELEDKIAILEKTLETLGVSSRGPGRPKGSKVRKSGKKKTKKTGERKKPFWSPAARKAASERQKERWAKRKKKTTKKTSKKRAKKTKAAGAKK